MTRTRYIKAQHLTISASALHAWDRLRLRRPEVPYVPEDRTVWAPAPRHIFVMDQEDYEDGGCHPEDLARRVRNGVVCVTTMMDDGMMPE